MPAKNTKKVKEEEKKNSPFDGPPLMNSDEYYTQFPIEDYDFEIDDDGFSMAGNPKKIVSATHKSTHEESKNTMFIFVSKRDNSPYVMFAEFKPMNKKVHPEAIAKMLLKHGTKESD